MEYIVINYSGTVMDTKEFATEKEAIDYADRIWNRMSEHDKEKLESFYVLKSINPDVDAINHFDGDSIKIYK